jgi:hypothetical protein
MIIECKGISPNLSKLGNLNGYGNDPGVYLGGYMVGVCYGAGSGEGWDLGRCEADDSSNYGGKLTGEGNFIP